MISNLTFAIIPYSKVAANGAVQFAFSLNRSLENGAVVYFSVVTSDNWLARYFNPGTQWLNADPAAIDADINAGKKVWIDTTALDQLTVSHPDWLRERTKRHRQVALVDSKHRIIFTQLVRPKS